ncbi:arrestin domain-containing protein 3 [Biomphalaria pfeifferi]|uniref:Arrestin domain-containing protein 3 n=1 Tax=Biomphalaria pfeifferi TaxID=112525 RepID=A0AAD8FMZ3_BIOPF|nr:arrestin domain-containing protein 3 [Biomphalaria pfeifferi]
MDYIRAFDVELDRSVYHSGDMLTGHVYIEVEENMRLQNIKVFLRGKAHAEWKITRAGERRTMKQEEHYLEERLMIWGKDDSDSHQGIPILTRGRHRYPFHFQLPETVLPCSFESKIGNIRYYVRVNLNIPYASCPQCIRYFTIIGPQIHCMDERYLSPVSSEAKKNSCSLCCGKGPMLLRTTLERSSYVCGEHILLKAEVQNGGNSEAWVLCKLIQYVEFFINKGVLGLSKEVRHTVLEVESEKVPPHETANLDELMAKLVIPIIPPTMVEVCGVIQIFYTLKIYLETSKGKGDIAEISMPITIGTVPCLAANNTMPEIHYEVAASNVEGGIYISPEFQLGQVYMGDEVDPETDQTILYRPVYVCVSGESQVPCTTDVHLLQVPSRQVNKSHDNKGSQEGLNVQELSSLSQHHVKMFLVSGEEGSCSSGLKVKKNIVEDQFLKEITAKLASRNVQERGDDGVRYGPGHGDQQQEIEAHVEMMRKHKKSNDTVHKALVNELRKHLSEGDENAEVEKVPRGLKKSSGAKKISETGNISDSSKPPNSYTSRDIQDEANVSLINDHSKQQAESPRRSQTVPTVQTFTKIYPKTVLSNAREEAEVEICEQTALLSESLNTSTETKCLPDLENVECLTNMQSSLQESFPKDLPTLSDQDGMTDFEKRYSAAVEQESSDFVPELHTVAEVNVRFSHLSSIERTVNTIIPAAIAATVTAAAPAAAELSPAKQTPSVAPKPKHKDRHSFPAARQTSDQTDEHTEHLLNYVIRPKSEMVDQTSFHDDSTA